MLHLELAPDKSQRSPRATCASCKGHKCIRCWKAHISPFNQKMSWSYLFVQRKTPEIPFEAKITRSLAHQCQVPHMPFQSFLHGGCRMAQHALQRQSRLTPNNTLTCSHMKYSHPLPIFKLLQIKNLNSFISKPSSW